MLVILSLKDCGGALLEVKLEDMTYVAWMKLNKVITYIKMVVQDEILVDLKGLTTIFEVWEIITLVNQLHHA